MSYECQVCGLHSSDLPNDVESEFFFEQTGSVTHCVTCDPEEVREW